MVWPFGRHVTAFEYLKEVGDAARSADKALDRIYAGGEPAPLLALLDAIAELDRKGLQVIEADTGSRKIAATLGNILEKVDAARRDVRRGDYETAQRILETIQAMVFEIVGAPGRKARSKELNAVLRMQPDEAFAAGFLFRGLTEEEWQRYTMKLAIYSGDPTAKVSVAAHIMHPERPDQFISLTSSAETARHFGGFRVVAVRVIRLKGVLLNSKEIERRCKGDTHAKRLQVKNSEFILAPTRNVIATLPPECFVR